MSMWMVSKGWYVCISLPSSTMGIKWPMAGVGYRTIASIAVEILVWECLPVSKFNTNGDDHKELQWGFFL